MEEVDSLYIRCMAEVLRGGEVGRGEAEGG